MAKRKRKPPVFKKQDRVPFSFHLGADPEFVFYLMNSQFNAQGVINKLYTGVNKGNMGYETAGGNIGWDGCSSTAEIRPKPAKTPEAMVEHIRLILATLKERNTVFDLDTRSHFAPIGGHIHFELPPGKTSEATLKTLHKKLASFYIPLIMGDEPTSTILRTGGSYGKITDHRLSNPTNNVFTLEFRVPSAEWLTTPAITQATLAYLGVVFHEILAHPNSFTKNNDLILTNSKIMEAVQTVATSRYEFLIEALIKRVKEVLRTFELYPQYESEINYILDYKRVLADKEAVNFNPILGWFGGAATAVTKKNLLSEKKLREHLSQVDLERLFPMVQIPFNDDFNVRELTNAIKLRVLALKWKLNKQYYFFGLRQGLTDFISFTVDPDFQLGNIYDRGNQIKTEGDLNAFTSQTTNPILTKLSNTRQVCVGIPYDLRQQMDTRAFIDYVYDLDTDKFAPLDLVNLDHSPAGAVKAVYDQKKSEDSLLTDTRQNQSRRTANTY